MRHISRFILIVAGAGLVSLLAGCGTTRAPVGGPYHVTAYRPHDPSAVRVKVSLSKENIYVMEGDRSLMAVACSIGLPNKPTPRGNFTFADFGLLDLRFAAFALTIVGLQSKIGV